MQIEGYLEFENSIPVNSNCLGKQFPITIAGIKGILATPVMFEGFNSSVKLGPLQSPEIGKIKFTDDLKWGSVFSWPSGDSEIQVLKILFQNISQESLEETSNKIALALEKWRDCLIANISFHLRKDYRGPSRSKTISSFGIGKFCLLELLRRN